MKDHLSSGYQTIPLHKAMWLVCNAQSSLCGFDVRNEVEWLGCQEVGLFLWAACQFVYKQTPGRGKEREAIHTSTHSISGQESTLPPDNSTVVIAYRRAHYHQTVPLVHSGILYILHIQVFMASGLIIHNSPQPKGSPDLHYMDFLSYTIQCNYNKNQLLYYNTVCLRKVV